MLRIATRALTAVAALWAAAGALAPVALADAVGKK